MLMIKDKGLENHLISFSPKLKSYILPRRFEKSFRFDYYPELVLVLEYLESALI